jgi:hypothetical protein
MTIQLKTADDRFKEIWDRTVMASAHGTIFHLWSWLKIAEVQSSTQFYPLCAYKGSELVAVYPIFIGKKGFFRIAYSPPPATYLLYLGPVILGYEDLKQDKKESLFTELQKEVDQYIFSNLKCSVSRIRTTPGLFDSRPLKWNGYLVDPLYTYRVDLSKGKDYVWSQFDRKLRVEINRAVREQIIVRNGTREDLLYILESLQLRFKQQGLSPRSYEKYLGELYDQFAPESLKLTIAESDGQRVGGMVSVVSQNGMALWIGIPKSPLKGISPNDLVQWTLIQQACDKGLQYYELMDAGDNPRLIPFKAKYNPQPHIWYSATKYSNAVTRFIGNLVQGSA